MNAFDAVQRCWSEIATRKHVPGATSAAVLDEIVQAYCEAHRHYHTLHHIACLLALLGRHGGTVSDPDAIVLAILFHDIVYDPVRRDNEEASAGLAQRHLAALEFPQPLIAKVGRYILATRHGSPAGMIEDADLALLLDLDLSILAAAPAEYRAYAQAIRREFALVPDALYRPGRRRVLEGFLARQHIYLTERLRSAWEQAARANIAAEIAELSQA